MLRLERDPSGDLARLACDRCGKVSGVALTAGRIDGGAAPLARDWLRMHCGSIAWSLAHSEEDGQAVTLDLCPKCTRKADSTARGGSRP